MDVQISAVTIMIWTYGDYRHLNIVDNTIYRLAGNCRVAESGKQPQVKWVPFIVHIFRPEIGACLYMFSKSSQNNR